MANNTTKTLKALAVAALATLALLGTTSVPAPARADPRITKYLLVN
jgi:hypothetical protein